MSAGTIPLSMTQQLDLYGQPLKGGELYIIVAGTVSAPQDAFADVGMTVKQPYPMTLDAAGRVPQFFVDNAINPTVKIRLTDASGVVQLAADNVLIIGPASGDGGGGGGAAVDPSAIYQTGDLKARYAVGIHPGVTPGWVRANGLSIGSASSGATMPEGASANCQALFIHLYNADPTLAVSGIRSGNALTDWNSNKNIATPDWRGYLLGALDGMGNAAANRLGAYFANADTLGSAGGSASATLTSGNLPPHTHSGTTGHQKENHNHNITVPNNTNTQAQVVPGASAFFWTGNPGTSSVTGNQNQDHDHDFTTDGGPGSSAPFGVISPRKLCTIYLKL